MIEVLAGILLMATIGGLLMWFAHHEDPECRDEAGGFYAVVFFVGIVFVFGAVLDGALHLLELATPPSRAIDPGRRSTPVE